MESEYLPLSILEEAPKVGVVFLHLDFLVIEVAVECNVHVQTLIVGIVLAFFIITIVDPTRIVHEFALAVDSGLLVQQSVVAAWREMYMWLLSSLSPSYRS